MRWTPRGLSSRARAPLQCGQGRHKIQERAGEKSNHPADAGGRRSRPRVEILPGRPGLATEGIVGTEFEHGAVAFFDLQPGLRLAIWPRESFAQDCGLPVAGRSPTEFSVAHNVSSSDEVDAVMEEARAAGATITKPAEATFYGGYAGYFQDLDGHLWEVAWNPQMLPDETK
jgi:uncharacterized protein